MTEIDDGGDRHLAIKVVMMPRDTNRYGTIFGGVLLGAFFKTIPCSPAGSATSGEDAANQVSA